MIDDACHTVMHGGRWVWGLSQVPRPQSWISHTCRQKQTHTSAHSLALTALRKYMCPPLTHFYPLWTNTLPHRYTLTTIPHTHKPTLSLPFPSLNHSTPPTHTHPVKCVRMWTSKRFGWHPPLVVGSMGDSYQLYNGWFIFIFACCWDWNKVYYKYTLEIVHNFEEREIHCPERWGDKNI
jgi:hypothetical protein